MVMFFAGFINSALTFSTFYKNDSRQVGCGIYLLGSSFTSLLTIMLFTIKFWFFVFTQINRSIDRSVLAQGCSFNACVNIERAITICRGIHFNKTKSRILARWVTGSLPLIIVLSILHKPLNRRLVDDPEEQRIWCMTSYSHSIQTYNTIILFFHFLAPFLCYLFSALCIISMVTHHRVLVLH
jgi:hypothetical protein